MPLGFRGVDDAAFYSRGDAYNRIELVAFNQASSLLLQTNFILCNYRQLVGIVDPIAEKKEAIDFMALIQQGLTEIERGGSGLSGIGGGIYDDRKFHSLFRSIINKIKSPA